MRSTRRLAFALLCVVLTIALPWAGHAVAQETQDPEAASMIVEDELQGGQVDSHSDTQVEVQNLCDLDVEVEVVPQDAASQSDGPISSFQDHHEQMTEFDDDDTTIETQALTVRGPKSAGALRVQGGKLVDKDGTPIQLRGVSTHGLAWFPAYVNGACFRQLRSEWNANVVRLAMYTAEHGGYCTGGDKAKLANLVKDGVRLAASNDLYAIVDWHILSDNNPLTHVTEAKSFFNDMSKTFSGSNNVLYEICNEPNGSTSWNDICRYANQVIPVIRGNDPDAVIIVGTPTWSQEIDKAAAKPLTCGNVLYALHFYAATHRDDLRNRMTSVVDAGLPVFVSEFGICDASGNGSIDQSSANAWLSAMNNRGISWCMWSLCNKAESASVLKSGCQATSGFKSGDLSTSGVWLLKALKGTLPDGTSDVPTGGSAGGASFSSGQFQCTVALTNSWQYGDGRICYQYDLTIRNTGAACSSWRVSIPFNQSVSLLNGWNATFEGSGTNLVAKNMSYNGSMAAGGVVSGIGFQVVAGSNLATRGAGGLSLLYRTHVQTYGWQKYVSAGRMSGTSGKSKRLEGINIRLTNAPCSGTIQYRTHVQRLGWQGWRSNGAMAGTSGRRLRLEAIEIRLVGELANRYDIYYRVHCQRFGWMGWAKNGARSGSAGYARRLEGIQIVLVRRGSKGPSQAYGGIRQNVSRAFAQRK